MLRHSGSQLRALRAIVALMALTLPFLAASPVHAGLLLFQSELTVTGLTQFNYEGGAVASSADGNTALVAARGYSNFAGRVTVFIRSGATWQVQTSLAPTVPASGDAFGTSLAISGDGNTALIGAPYKLSNSGAVYVFTRSGTIWTQSTILTAPTIVTDEAFGASVALSRDGSTAAIGVPRRASGFTDGVGAVALYSRSGSGPFVAGPILTPSNGMAYDNFGAAVAVNADGGTVVVGAAAKANNTGAAYVFARSSGTYTGAALPFAPATGDYFGASVAVSAGGTSVLIGAPRTTVSAKSNAGAAYLFTGSGSSYTAGSTFTAADGQPDDQFGFVVAVSGNVAVTDDAASIAISAPYRNSNVGGVYTLTHENGTTYMPSQTFTGVYVSGTTQYTFGLGLALSADSMTAIFGAPGKNSNTGTAYAYFSRGDTPTVAAISPTSGPIDGGTPVTITGANFNGVASVAFGSVASSRVTRTGTTQIVVIAPASTVSAIVDITFTNGDGKSITLPRAYEYVLASPPSHVVNTPVGGMSTPKPLAPLHISAPLPEAMTPTPLPAPARH